MSDEADKRLENVDPPTVTHAKGETYLSDKTANRVIGVVTAVWVLNVVAGVAGKYTGYEPSDLIHGIFLAVVGGAFALKNQKKDG